MKTDNLGEREHPCTSAEQSGRQIRLAHAVGTDVQQCEHGTDPSTSKTQDAHGNTTKSIQRHAALKRRATMVTKDLRRSSGLALCEFGQQLMQELNLATSSTVAAYVSMGTEIPTEPLLELLNSSGMRIIVPRLGKSKTLNVDWAEYQGAALLHHMPRSPSGGLRPREPEGQPLGRAALHKADLVLVPALGVSSDGSRLGRGAGWYDRALLNANENAPVVAICWSWELNTQVPCQAHDIPVDATLSEQGLTWISYRSHDNTLHQ